MSTRINKDGIEEYVFDYEMDVEDLESLLEIAKSRPDRKTTVVSIHIDNRFERDDPSGTGRRKFSAFGLRNMGKGKFEVRNQPRCKR